MKIKQLALILLCCFWGLTANTQTLLDPMGNPTTEVYPEIYTANSTAPASTSATIVNVIPSPTGAPMEMAFDGQYLWVSGWQENVLFQISPTNGSVIKTIPIAGIGSPFGLTFDGQSLWVVDNVDKMIIQLDTLDGSVLSSFPTIGDPLQSYPTGLAWDGTTIWHNDTKSPNIDLMEDVLYNFETNGNPLSEMLHLDSYPTGLAFQNEYLWCSDNTLDKIYKIDLNTFTALDTFDAPGGNYPNALAFDGQYLWVGNNDSDSLYQIEVEPSNNLNLQFATQDPLCNGDMNGSISVNYSPPDTMLFFNWSTGDNVSSISNLGPGDYGLTITNAEGVIVSETTTTLIDPEVLVIDLSATSSNIPTCFGSNDGSLLVVPEGGVPGYTYEWGTGETTPQIMNLFAGFYDVSITDNNGCSISTSLELSQPDQIEFLSVTTPETENLMDGTAGFTEVTGGTPPYTFQWNTNPVQLTMMATGLAAGEYTVIGRDANDCIFTAIFEVEMTTNTMDELGVTAFNIFPNPASATAYIELEFKNNQDWDISIYQVD